MKPETLKTKIFLDSGDSKDTESILSLLGFLDGQTTNPSLIAVSPGAKERLLKGEKFSKKELFDLYKETVQQISSLIPEGSVSVEVYADKDTGANEMYEQGKEMFSWIKNAHIKYPTNKEGLKTVAYGNLIAPLIEALKVQESRIESQESRIESQDNKIEQLIKEIKQLKNEQSY